MKKWLVFFLSFLLVIITVTAFRVRETIAHSGVRIAAVPLVANGTLIKMEITSNRENQSIIGVTYELVDDENVNVHVDMDYLARNEEQEAQTLQLLLPTETKVHFLVNDQMMDIHLEKIGSIWKTIG